MMIYVAQNQSMERQNKVFHRLCTILNRYLKITTNTEIPVRNNVLKSLSGSTCSKKRRRYHKHRTIGRPITDYAVPNFAPSSAPQTRPLFNLHTGTTILQYKLTPRWYGQQYSLKCHQPQHPTLHLTELQLPKPPCQYRDLINKPQ